jgi:hypothetical protein
MLQPSRDPDVVGVEEREQDFVRARDASVAGSSRAGVFLLDQADGGVAEGDGSGCVGGTVVDHDDRIDGNGLPQNGFDGLAQVSLGVPSRDHDG